MDQNNQSPKQEGEQLIEAPPEEKLIDPPEEEKLISDRTSANKNFSIPKLLFIILGIIIIIGIGGYGYYVLNTNQAIKSDNTLPVSEPVTPEETPTNNSELLPIQKTPYTNALQGYSFQYPTEYEIEKIHNNTTNVLNDTITWSEELIAINPSDCKGSCPVRESEEQIQINGLNGVKVKGYVGAAGGNIPQSFVSYEIPMPNSRFFVIKLWELPQTMSYNELSETYELDRQQGVISAEDEAKFDEIVSTFTLQDSESLQPGVPNEQDQVMCTMDAKLCADGSAVGRQGPDCEFAACPGE